ADDSIAAGYGGIVQPGHDGSFVWGDDQSASFESSGVQQFLLRAGGGVGINTNNIGGNDDVVMFPRANGDADSDLRFRTRSGSEGLIYVADADATMYISANGGVHITDPVEIARSLKTASISVEGNATKATAGAWKANSDGRIKDDIEPVGNALDTLSRLHPVTFRYTDSYRAGHAGIADQRYYNVIAQQFAEVFPDAVTGSGEYLAGAPKTPENEILQVDTYPAQIVTIAAVQELAEKNAALQAKVERLIARLAKLENAQGK
ncbi:MAG: tail fiber domain-containing protein, partial [Rhodanobacteraceae bacterium]